VKFLVACTPNGATSFISPVFVGPITDYQLTSSSGFLEILKDKPGIPIMADRGFTIKDILQKINVDLNLPAFMEGRIQLPPEQVQEDRKIASLRIHVERAMGRLKSYNKPNCICVCISFWHPVLVPPPPHLLDGDNEDYWDQLSDSDGESIECSKSFESNWHYIICANVFITLCIGYMLPLETIETIFALNLR